MEISCNHGCSPLSPWLKDTKNMIMFETVEKFSTIRWCDFKEEFQWFNYNKTFDRRDP